MRSHPGVAARMFQTLADLDINLDMIGTSPIKISCVIEKKHVDRAVRELHKIFGLDDDAVFHEPTDRGSC
jgi:aspartate kinase